MAFTHGNKMFPVEAHMLKFLNEDFTHMLKTPKKKTRQ